MRRKLIACIATLVLCTGFLSAQGYRIEVQIDGAKDSTIILAMYYGENKYAKDTAKTDQNGYAVFSKETPLPGGLYLLVAGNVLLCDFLISDDNSQQFKLHYQKTSDNTAEIVYTHSPENTAFVAFQKYMGERQRMSRNLHEKAQKDTTFIPTAKDSLAIIEKEEKAYAENASREWQGKLLGSMAKAMQPPARMPELDIPKDNPKRDSLLWTHYYTWERDHFFDNVDFSDARLLNTPVFLPNFDYYFSKKLVQHPDSIIPQAHAVLERAKANRDMFMFCLGHLFNTYIQWKTITITSDYALGMEAVVVDLIKTYYLSGQADWAEKDTTFMKQIRDYAFYNENSLVGMKDRDLRMATITGQYESIYDIQAPYTLLVFFDTECGHCKTEIPKLHEIYKKYRDKGFQVYCVYIQVDGPKWQEFVNTHNLDWINVWDPHRTTQFHDFYGVTSTPQVFLLDKDKTIVARRVSEDLLSQLLDLFIDKKPIQNAE
jgi:thiol-disulfide isomerase/thioredoxin